MTERTKVRLMRAAVMAAAAMTDVPSLALIMHRLGNGKLAMSACRGAGKGCNRNRYRKTKVPCEDCMGPLPEDMTMAQVLERLEKGDA